MASAVSTTRTSVAPTERPSQSGMVNRPMYEESQKVSKDETDSPNSQTPVRAPATKRIPSTLRVAAATREVPGQKPPTTKPTPMTRPPRIPGHR
jgi:hypothetical protein